MLKPFSKSGLKKFYKNLPRKRIAAGVIILNNKKQILALKTSYKPHWNIAGGVVEADETPLQACRRETKEETNLSISKNLRLLCIDYEPSANPRPESIQMIFYAGLWSEKQLAQLKIDNHEIIKHRFVTANQATKLFGGKNSHLGRRLKYCLLAIKNNSIYYLENGIKK